MEPQVSPEVFARAMVVAENLKQQLEARLINKTSHGWSCSCGACGAGPSRVVAIRFPTTYQYQIALWMLWSCSMEDNTGKRWSQNIGSFIPWTELYPMFRQAFAGIDVRVEHPYALSYSCDPAPFVSSGRTVEISSKNSIFVRPIGDLSQSVWVNAELRVDSGLKEHSGELVIACNIDALEFDQRRGSGNGDYSCLYGQTFYIYIAGSGHGPDIHLPIARVLSANREAGSATIELDQSVEVFLPQ